MKLLIIGGSDAGISAALRATEVSSNAEVTVALADHYPNYSICGIPFWLGGEVADYHDLAHRTKADIEAKGIELLVGHTATYVHPEARQVEVRTDEEVKTLEYDALILGTGAKPTKPPIGGLGLPGVYLLRTMGDSFKIHNHLTEKQPKRAVIVGAGYIGLEMAEAFRHRGLETSLVELTKSVMPSIDAELGKVLEQTLTENGVEVSINTAVERIERVGNSLLVTGSDGSRLEADVVVVATGVVPETALAETAGVKLGAGKALCVNERMETNVADIYAAGDYVQTYHRLLKKYTYTPLGTTAHKQGYVAGENAVGSSATFAGSLGTQTVKLFDLVIARTGLRDAEAREAGFDPLTVSLTADDHKAYYPGATPLHLRLTGDRTSGKLLGVQIVGHRSAEVSKRVDIVATALYHGMMVKNLLDLDLSYAPPLSSPWDPVQMAAQVWLEHVSRGEMVAL